MKVYKPIQMIKELSSEEMDNLSKLFSKENQIIYCSNNFALVRYSPDVYFKNGKAIGQLFESRTFVPLIMTNYKFLALLLICSSNPQFVFSDFSFKKEDDSEEADESKSYVRDLLKKEREVSSSFEFLKESGQKISSIELKQADSSEFMIINSSGNIAFSNNFDVNQDHVLDIVQFLFTGRAQ
jgi:hypothetical protein